MISSRLDRERQFTGLRCRYFIRPKILSSKSVWKLKYGIENHWTEICVVMKIRYSNVWPSSRLSIFAENLFNVRHWSVLVASCLLLSLYPRVSFLSWVATRQEERKTGWFAGPTSSSYLVVTLLEKKGGDRERAQIELHMSDTINVFLSFDTWRIHDERR